MNNLLNLRFSESIRLSVCRIAKRSLCRSIFCESILGNPHGKYPQGETLLFLMERNISLIGPKPTAESSLSSYTSGKSLNSVYKHRRAHQLRPR